MSRLRVLAMADTHVGSTFPRGVDPARGLARALEPARHGAVDVVLHGGDLFDRPGVAERILWQGLGPLFEAARHVPVVVVPGNHERGLIDVPPLLRPPRLHVLDRPRTVELELGGLRVAIGGFPFHRHAGPRFGDLVEATGLGRTEADVRILLLHQAVEGTRVGPHDFTFRRGAEVVRPDALPAGLAVVVAGHVHRHQTLRRGVGGRALASPVVVPGSTVPTSFQERLETKGYVLLDLEAGPAGGRLAAIRHVRLPTKPMHVLDVDADDLRPEALARRLRGLPGDALIQLRLPARLDVSVYPVLRAAALGEIAAAGQVVHVPWRRMS